MVFLRGDHMLNEAKLAGAVPEAQIPTDACGRDSGSVFGRRQDSWGRLDLKATEVRGAQGARFWWTRALQGRKNLVSGANKEDYHLRNVTPGRDFESGRSGPTCAMWRRARAVRIAVSR